MAQASVPMPTPMSPAGNVTPPSSGGGPGNSCHRCGEEIKTAQFIRVGDYKFHKQHFTCVMCDKHLQGQKFNLKDGKFYCADDYILKFCHTCRHCKQKIPMGSVIQAFGGYYHPEHFVCVVCNEPFKNGKYYESDNQPYCETHFLALTAEKCDFCKKPVEEQNIARVQGKVFHNSCLFCHHCNAPLAKKGSIFQKDNQVYCKEDYLNFFCKRCTACGQHLVNSCITVNDEFYHPECLKCDVCSKKLDKYICMAGHLRCEEHTDFTTDKFDCSVCLKSIDGVPVLAAGKKCHEECFVCAFCADKLTKTASWLKQDQFCCGKCLMIKEEGRKRTQSTSNPASLSAPSNAVPAKRRNSESAPRSNGEQKINSLDSVSENGGTGSGKGPRGSVTPKEKKIEWKKGELIGKGSFGKVYMGMNAATGELIAVKQVRLKTTEEQDQAKEIENEIKLMQDLRHPNIVSLLGTQRTGTTLNILMEYVPGKSLDTLLEKFGAFSEKVNKSYTKQLLAALAYCHSNHVVHRDIKGKNILIDTKGNLKLADFGSAKRFANVLSKDAPSVSYNYTPLWTAPEVLVGDYNSKVDIWSLGCVIIEMASGKPPWSEQNFENPFRALYHIGNSNSIPKIPDTLSDQGKQFILACLQRDPDKRPSAKECLSHAWLKDADDDADDSSNSNEADDD